jgi:hypothetical protein
MFPLKLYRYIPEGSSLDAVICRRPGPGVIFQIPTAKPRSRLCHHHVEEMVRVTMCNLLPIIRFGVRLRSNRWALAFMKGKGELHVSKAN